MRFCWGSHVLVPVLEITLIKGKIEEIELPVKEVDIIVSEVSQIFASRDDGLSFADQVARNF